MGLPGLAAAHRQLFEKRDHIIEIAGIGDEQPKYSLRASGNAFVVAVSLGGVDAKEKLIVSSEQEPSQPLAIWRFLPR